MTVQDTQISPFGLGSFATRGTSVGGTGIKIEAEAARELVLQAATEQLGVGNIRFGRRREGRVRQSQPGAEQKRFAKLGRNFVYAYGGMHLLGQVN